MSFTFEMCRVVQIHAEENAVDVTVMRTQQAIAGVRVLTSSMCGTDLGTVDLCEPTENSPLDPYGQVNTHIRDVFCIVGWLSRDIPFVFGFVCPQVSQIKFMEKNLRVARHGSDLYTTLNGVADSELYNPSGSYLRLAADKEHVVLDGTDYDALWELKYNLDTAPSARLRIANGGVDRATIDVDANGDIHVTSHTGDEIHINAEVGEVIIEAEKDVTVTSRTGDVNVSAPAGSINVTAFDSITTLSTTLDQTGVAMVEITSAVTIILTAPVIVLNGAVVEVG
jgi:hypothetical protein